MIKRLGQHFLVNQEKIKKIVDALEFKDGDAVVEVGPGHGELTKEIGLRIKELRIRNKESGIKNQELRLIAIEKDERLAQDLRHRIKDLGFKNTEIIKGDALRTLPRLVNALILNPKSYGSYKLVGNIPYYITGKLLRVIGELEHKPELAVLTVQKEVAERLTAKPPKMNLLAASVQFWAEPEIVDYISRKDFRPRPKVDSAIIRLRTRKDADQNADRRGNYYQVARTLFKQPRKTILNNLTTNNEKLTTKNEMAKKLLALGVDPNDRPQVLGMEEIKKIVSAFFKKTW